MKNSDVDGYYKMEMLDASFLINNIVNTSHKLSLFPKGIKVVFKDSLNTGTLMEWRGRTLSISNAKYAVDDGYFCPSEHLLSAFRKLKEQKELSFKEEYAIETLFHESIHSKGKFIHFIEEGTTKEAVMETCTQILAREQYVKILDYFNVSPTNFDKIKTDGYGYIDNCRLVRKLFVKDGVLQTGELSNITTGIEDGEKIIRKRLAERYKLKDKDINLFISLISIPEP